MVLPLRSFLLVVDGISCDVEVVGGWRVPGEGDEPGGGDDGLQVGGWAGHGVMSRQQV